MYRIVVHYVDKLQAFAISVVGSGGPRKHVLDGIQIPHPTVQFLRKTTCPGMPDDTLPWPVQKRLNRSRCRLGCGLMWAQESMCYMGGGTLTPPLNCPCAAAMQPYVKLLWPLVLFCNKRDDWFIFLKWPDQYARFLAHFNVILLSTSKTASNLFYRNFMQIKLMIKMNTILFCLMFLTRWKTNWWLSRHRLR